MDNATVTSVAAGIATVLSIGFAVVENFKKNRALAAKGQAEDAQKIIAVKDELIAVAQESKQAWKEKYESEHREYNEYRQECHAKLNDASAKVLHYSSENAELRAKTDLSPILEHQREQTSVTAKIIETLGKINTTQDLLIESILNNAKGLKKVMLPGTTSPKVRKK